MIKCVYVCVCGISATARINLTIQCSIYLPKTDIPHSAQMVENKNSLDAYTTSINTVNNCYLMEGEASDQKLLDFDKIHQDKTFSFRSFCTAIVHIRIQRSSFIFLLAGFLLCSLTIHSLSELFHSNARRSTRTEYLNEYAYQPPSSWSFFLLPY